MSKWISVSEKLPEVGKIVLVYQEYSNVSGNKGAPITIGMLYKRNENTIPYWKFQHYRTDFEESTISDNGIICPGSEYVVAWMPLPEPYKKEESIDDR
jgi:hypothetical protein